MKIYISLPITGYDLQERKQYAENVRSRLQQIYPDGEIITPFDVCADPSLPYEELIGKDISALLTCDMVYVCNGMLSRTEIQTCLITIYQCGRRIWRGGVTSV